MSVAIKAIKKAYIQKTFGKHRESYEELKVMELLKKAKCPNILQLYETFEDSENYYTVTKYMSVGNLTNYLLKQSKMPLSESLIKKIIY